MRPMIFIRHALDRLEQRGISKELIIDVITSPDEIDQESEKRRIAQKIINGKLIRVIYDDEGDSVVVISAYVTSKLGKYLRK